MNPHCHARDRLVILLAYTYWPTYMRGLEGEQRCSGQARRQGQLGQLGLDSLFHCFLQSEWGCSDISWKCVGSLTKGRLSVSKQMHFRKMRSISLTKIYLANFLLYWGYIWPREDSEKYNHQCVPRNGNFFSWNEAFTRGGGGLGQSELETFPTFTFWHRQPSRNIDSSQLSRRGGWVICKTDPPLWPMQPF